MDAAGAAEVPSANAAADPRAKLWIGPAGWSYEDWYGIVYPAPPPRGFKPLAHIGRLFNTVEVNSSFYRLPSPRMTAAWPEQVPADFRFTVKLLRDFTHGRELPGAEAAAAFADALSPLRAARKLGPLLIQFPWSFRYGPAAVERLKALAGLFAGFDRVIEVRHDSWQQPEALAALGAAGGICSIDQPRLPNCLPPTDDVPGSTAYVRLHGRNARNWFRKNAATYERYDYLYDPRELREWVTRLNRMAGQAHDLYVIANNHYRGQGPVNALELRALLTGETVAAPPELIATYPRLATIATVMAEEPRRQRELFDED